MPFTPESGVETSLAKLVRGNATKHSEMLVMERSRADLTYILSETEDMIRKRCKRGIRRFPQPRLPLSCSSGSQLSDHDQMVIFVQEAGARYYISSLCIEVSLIFESSLV